MIAFSICFLAWGARAEEIRECARALSPKPIEAELLAQKECRLIMAF
jgi:hypothetical protein